MDWVSYLAWAAPFAVLITAVAVCAIQLARASRALGELATIARQAVEAMTADDDDNDHDYGDAFTFTAPESGAFDAKGLAELASYELVARGRPEVPSDGTMFPHRCECGAKYATLGFLQAHLEHFRGHPGHRIGATLTSGPHQCVCGAGYKTLNGLREHIDTFCDLSKHRIAAGSVNREDPRRALSPEDIAKLDAQRAFITDHHRLPDDGRGWIRCQCGFISHHESAFDEHLDSVLRTYEGRPTAKQEAEQNVARMTRAAEKGLPFDG